MPFMFVRVSKELWLLPTGDPECPWELGPPVVVNHFTGEGMPGMLAPEVRPFVLHAGETVYLEARGFLPRSVRDEQRQSADATAHDG